MPDKCSAALASPINHLTGNIAASSFNLAPEHELKLAKLRDLHQFEIELVAEPGFKIRVLINEHKIILPVAALEYIWACALRFWVVTDEYRKAQLAGQTTIDVHAAGRLELSARSQNWTLENMSGAAAGTWPAGLPQPLLSPTPYSDEHVADELFLGAVGWIILHEIAHVELGHSISSGSLSQKEEKDADLFATEWVLGGIDCADPRFKKRCFCIATALLCLQSLETEAAQTHCGRNHPPANERLDYNLSPYRACGNIESVEAFVAINLQSLFAATGIKANIDGQTFSEILDDLLFDITRLDSPSA